MNTEYSYGIILFFKNDDGENEFLVINQKSENGSFRGFPKGHIEEGETELQAAKREVEEEVGIKDIRIIGDNTFSTSYTFKSGMTTITKNVTFFVGEVKDKNITIQEEELNGYKWATFNTAMNILSHKNYKSILENVKKYIDK